jgi:asparagine synthase (glutamine-hydrolysing)
VRSPFLDQDVAQFARRIPHDYKFRHGHTKYLLKSALRGVIPDRVIDRRKKGFGIPAAKWLRDWNEADFARAGAVVRNPAWVAGRLAEHKARRRDHRLALWCLLALGHHGEARA